MTTSADVLVVLDEGDCSLLPGPMMVCCCVVAFAFMI